MLGKDILDVARPHVGERYVLGAVVSYSNPAWKGPWDCAEFATWCVFQAYGFLFGCAPNGEAGSAYTGQWKTDARNRARLISASAAARVPGAFLLRYPPSGGIGHIVICTGDGATTVEAADSTRGVIVGAVAGRRWDTGVLLPGVEYDLSGTGEPDITRAEPLPSPSPRVVQIQLALRARGFDPGPADGLFGEMTQAAIAAFQASMGLVVDGEVGPQTAAALLGGDDAAAPAAAPGGRGVGAAAAAAVAPRTPILSTKHDDLKDEYIALFATAVLSAAKAAEIRSASDRVVAGRARYESVATRLGAIPWYVVGVINELESTSNFSTHLHNGDSLSRRTVNVPAGRPPGGNPPFTWEESAVDALTMKDYHRFTDWSLSRILHRLEGYNGWGTRRQGVFTPYLWSGCQHYSKGKFVRDGVWDANAVSRQIGCAVILKELEIRGVIPPLV